MVDVGNDRNVSEVLAEVLLRHGWISLVHDTLAETSRSERKSSGEGKSREDEWRMFGGWVRRGIRRFEGQEGQTEGSVPHHQWFEAGAK